MITNLKYVSSFLLFSMSMETNIAEEKGMCKEQVRNSDLRAPRLCLLVRTGRGEDYQAKGHPGKLGVWVSVGLRVRLFRRIGH